MNSLTARIQAHCTYKINYIRTGAYCRKKKHTPAYFYIVITGFMASGKTSFGNFLASCLHAPCFDTDAMIQNSEQMTVCSIFEHKGEHYFRAREFEAVQTLLSHPGVSLRKHQTGALKPQESPLVPQLIIVSLGGGAVAQQQVRALLAKHASKLIVLRMHGAYHALIKRLSVASLDKTQERPIFKKLKDSTAFYRLYKKRERLYKYCSAVTVYSALARNWLQQ